MTSPHLSILQLVDLYNKDTSPQKLNLTIGVCMGDNKSVYKFSTVKEVSLNLLQSPDFNHNYLGAAGHTGLGKLASKLVFGQNSTVLAENKVLAFQAVGGGGALSLAAHLVAKMFSIKQIYVSSPTWDPHYEIFGQVLQVSAYRYYNCASQSLDFDGMLYDLNNAEPSSAVLLHASCHNPSGGALSKEQWGQILDLVKDKNLFPFFDIAYQGFGTSLDDDAYALRLFADGGIEFVVAQTFSKNFGIYGERLGFVFAVVGDSSLTETAQNYLEDFVALSYAIPPAFPAKIVYEILNSESLTEKWMEEFDLLRKRISAIRLALKESLVKKVPHVNFDFVTNNEGLFLLFDFKGDEAKILREKYHVYVLENGRVNVSGLTLDDVDYFAEALASIL